jgi:tripeptidyl-peptidase-1
MFIAMLPEASSSVSPLGSTTQSKVNHFLLGCRNYSVPAHVREHVDLIKPTVQFNHRPSPLAINKRTGGLGVPTGRNGPKKSSKTVSGITPSLDNCDEMITLDCLRALYSINHTPVATSKNTYGIGT